MGFKATVFRIIQPDDGTSRASRLFDDFITALILASVVSVFVGTFNLSPELVLLRDRFELIVSIIFTVEYLLRIWTADLLYPKYGAFTSRLRYIFSSMALVDLVAILPLFLPMFLPKHVLSVRALRLIRLYRVVKLDRYFDAFRSIGEVFVVRKRELISSMFFVGLVMMVSSLLMFSVEHPVQPDKFRNAFSGLWWAVATLTTVGYGDICPITTPGRILGIVTAFFGIAALAIPTGIITSGLMDLFGKDRAQDKELARQRVQDAEHDRILKELSSQIAALRQQLAERQTSQDVKVKDNAK